MSFPILDLNRVAMATRASFGLVITTALWLSASATVKAAPSPEVLESGAELVESMLPVLYPEASETDDRSPDSQEASESHPRQLVLKLQERRVYVMEDNQAITSFPVGIGKVGWETPTGQFKVMQKVPDPTWRHPWNGTIVPPGPNNPLGRHWIGFWSDGKNRIGFHGTIDESLIGQAVSHGCVRMKNADVAQLFTMVEEGTLVTVEP